MQRATIFSFLTCILLCVEANPHLTNFFMTPNEHHRKQLCKASIKEFTKPHLKNEKLSETHLENSLKERQNYHLKWQYFPKGK